MKKKTALRHGRLFCGSILLGVLLGTLYFNLNYWKMDPGSGEIYYTIPELLRTIRIGKDVWMYLFSLRLKQAIVGVLLYFLLPVRLFFCVIGVFVGFVFSIFCCLQAIISLTI